MIKKTLVDKNIKKLKKQIDGSRLPKHIAIIMDGNGRWAKKRLMPRSAGHRAGVERVKEIVEEAGNIGINYLTLYAFSTENWRRPKNEVDYLMKLLVEYLRNELDTLHKNNVKINVLGNIDKLPSLPRDEIVAAMKRTKENSKLVLNIALNYGGRFEMIEAVKKCIKDYQLGKLSTESINEESFKSYLFTGEQPDPDLLIRPSGEKRISNFLLYQIAYTEFWFTDVYWPDFSRDNLYKAIIDFQNRKRRYGGV